MGLVKTKLCSQKFNHRDIHVVARVYKSTSSAKFIPPDFLLHYLNKESAFCLFVEVFPVCVCVCAK